MPVNYVTFGKQTRKTAHRLNSKKSGKQKYLNNDPQLTVREQIPADVVGAQTLAV
jgi:hypothetical protein